MQVSLLLTKCIVKLYTLIYICFNPKRGNISIMSYHNDKRNIKDTDKNKTVAVANYEVGAEIIVKALNYYFGDTYTRNEAVEMMHQNTSDALKNIANFLEKYEYTGEMAIEYLRELSEEMEAQALVVSMRDELKFEKPTD
jgi:hypothetical protein